MTEFHKKNWSQRMTSGMGDQAEGVYEEVYGDESERFGFNLPRFPIRNIPPILRYAPDYIHGTAPARFVEVQGFSTALKVKIEKIGGLFHWQTHLPVHLFFYSSLKDDYCEIELNDFLKLAGQKATLSSYDEGSKPYLRFTPGVLPWSSDGNK